LIFPEEERVDLGRDSFYSTYTRTINLFIRKRSSRVWRGSGTSRWAMMAWSTCCWESRQGKRLYGGCLSLGLF